ncbi:MAG: orotidine-5'-phosphate decarboxylase [Pseudomonadota bacterium]
MTSPTRLPRQGLAPKDRLITALDVANVDTARRLVAEIGDACGFYKIGYRLAYSGGLALVGELAAAGHRTFLDLKLLDIDNTVAEGTGALAGLGATCLTVHAYPHAMRAAAANRGDLAILAVTVLTSLDGPGLHEAGYETTPEALVARRAAQAAAIGIDGIVCSGHEAASVRAHAPHLAIVTPGIRPQGAARGDQARAMTPARAIAAGADYLVVGRPITQSPDPRAAAQAIAEEIAAADSPG